MNNAIDGTVITFEDRTEINRAQRVLMMQIAETTAALGEPTRDDEDPHGRG